jgi:molybdopterin converting factor small subunit
MVGLRLFGPARDAAGVARAEIPGDCVAEILEAAEERYGARFAEVVGISRVWVDRESATTTASVADQDEAAVVLPVSGS